MRSSRQYNLDVQRPIIALLTDFGLRDPYVAAMKGVVLSLCREATLVDIAHELPAQDVTEAALCLEAVFNRFPEGTVFVVVVDPGVGSRRRALAAQSGGRQLVGPDNGVLSLVLAADPAAEVREIVERSLLGPTVSATFHGRDVFAPVAARLAGGLALAGVGPLVTDLVRISLPAAELVGPDEWRATVVHVDRFGNLVTSFSEHDLRAARQVGGAIRLRVRVGGAEISLVNTYSDVPAGEPCALLGSTGRLEVAVRGDSAARRLGAGVGRLVQVRSLPRVGSGDDVL
jgi:S-adenosylmethionine hydrolase